MRSWVRKLDADNNELWTDSPAQAGVGVTAEIAIDPWGEVVTVSVEDCTVDTIGLLPCELVVRKYTADGALLWKKTWDTEAFTGQLDNLPGYDASLAIDRFGYVYVTAVVYTANTGTDWWARKLHP